MKRSMCVKRQLQFITSAIWRHQTKRKKKKTWSNIASLGRRLLRCMKNEKTPRWCTLPIALSSSQLINYHQVMFSREIRLLGLKDPLPRRSEIAFGHTTAAAQVNKVWAVACKLSICLGRMLEGLWGGGRKHWPSDSIDTSLRVRG